MALTEKGQIALNLIKKYFAEGVFSAKSLSEVSGEKVAAASLTSLAKKGFLNRIESTPVTYTLDKEFVECYREVVIPLEKKGNDNKRLGEARKAKNDEFYTRREDIETELSNYRKYFIGKTIFLNCDDPRESEFWKYFERQFGFLQLKKLVATHYQPAGKSYKLEYFGDIDENGNITEAQIIKTPLMGDGDFRSNECIEILQESDIIVTNPPFSLFREYIAQLIKYEKQFIILGNPNAITYKEIFPYIKNNKIWLGHKSTGKDMYFHVTPEYQQELLNFKKEGSGYVIKDGEVLGRVSAVWYTNLPTKKRAEELSTGARYYDENHKVEDYPTYDTYDAIEVGKVANIPMDYEGVMGVPITFLDKYNPDQFEILGKFDGGSEQNPLDLAKPLVNGKAKYKRLAVRNKHPRRSRKS